jgi:PAS domain S-box-containing protein
VSASTTTPQSEPDQPRRFGGRFRATRVLRAGPAGETLRGIDASDGGEVVIRTMVGPDLAATARMEQELAALARLDGTDLVRPLAVGREGAVLYSVVPYVAGVTLEAHLDAIGRPLTVAETLAVGRGVLGALAEAHRCDWVHRDVRPSNVVVDVLTMPTLSPSAGPTAAERTRVRRATLVDFGIAQLRRAAGAPPESGVRAARYSSPEAAGSVAHEVDERSDLYSVGAVLFECLAGRALFDGETVGEVLRQHVTEPVPRLRTVAAAVPAALDQVVQRLLMKEPADRYASAQAALADLDAIASALESGDPDPDVVVGATDPRGTLAQPAFVGREAELAAIGAEVEQARLGRGGLVLVEGESGGGKTKLLDELAQRSTEQGIWVLRGQGVDQMAQRPLQVLDGVVEAVVRRSEEDPRFVLAAGSALGGHLEALVDALPSLAGTFGGTESHSLGPEAYGEARSLPALTAFLDALGAMGAPVMVVLDDCQWADELTLKLVSHWSSHRPTGDLARRVMVVAAFRSEEVPPGHLLRRLDPRTHLALPALAEVEMRRMLVSMAGPLPEEAVAVVEQLCEGNPFMATAVLRGLVETGAIVHDAVGWGVHPTAMAGVQTSRHAAAFLSRRLDLLPAPARRLLAVGALLGKEFDAGLAASLIGQDAAEAAAGIEEARRRHILWSSDNDCTFVHDKLREALLAQMDEADRRSLHRDAALAFEAQDTDRVFELAYHFDAAGDVRRALPYALAAAERARSQHALEIAERQYRIAERGVVWADDDARRHVAEGLGDVLMLRGHYEEAAAQLATAGRLAADVVDRAEIEGKLGELAFKRGDVASASEAVERAVRLLGRRMPRRPLGYLVSAIGEIIVQAFHTLLPGLFLARRRPDGARAELLVVRLYSRLAYIYWFQRGRFPCLWAHLREMNLAERYPPSAELAQAYSEHAPVMTMVPWFSRGQAYGERSLQIRANLGDVWGEGQSLHFIGVVLYAASRYQDCIDHCRRAVAHLDRTGDCWEANTARWHIAFSHYRLGDLAAAVEAAKGVRQAAVEIGDHQAAGIALGAWAKAASGDLPAEVVHAELLRVGEDVHTSAEILQAEAVRLIAADQPAEAATVLLRAARMVAAKGLKQEYVAPIQPWLATALRLEAESTPPWSARRRQLMRRATRAARRARRIARSYPNNQPHALRESAHLAALAGKPRRARRRFDRSLDAAERQGARHEHAKTLLARGLVGLEADWPEAAEDVAEARRALAELAAPSVAEADGQVTLSLLDRFDTLLEVGQQIASALTPHAVYGAVGDAGLALLRAEDCAVLAVEPGETLSTKVVAASSARPVSAELVADALVAGRPVVLDTDPDETDGPVRSALCAPVFVRGRAVACFYLTHGQVGALFGEEEVRLAEFIATLAGTALENAEGFAEVQALSRSLERRVAERTTELAETNLRLAERSEAVALLRTIAVASNEASSVEEALQVAVDEVCRHTGWPVGHVCRVAEDLPGEAIPTTIWHLDDPDRYAELRHITETTRLPMGSGLPGRVAAARTPVWIPDVLADSNFPLARRGVNIGVRAGFAVPLLAGQDVVGVIEFFSPDPLDVDRRLLDLVAQVGTELGRVVERKRSEDALRHGEERTRSILAAANDAFIGMDQDGLITDWNSSAETIFGWPAQKVIGRALADTIVPERYRRSHREGLQRFLDTGETPMIGRRLELVALHRDGRHFPVELSMWETISGPKHFFNAFVQDITERKLTEQALAVARDQAMEASRMKSQFLATMSHEIRTPMNGVIGLAELLLGSDLRPEQRTYAEGLHSAGESLLAVINDILDFSKIEAGKLELEDVEFDPRHLVDDVVQLLAPAAHAKGLELVGMCSKDLPLALRGDPGRLRQILVNLTSNAVKFTARGEVVVRMDDVGVTTGDWSTIRLQVTDTGIGIDPADQRHILEPFSQADASTTRRYGGTGLGLAICRQLAEIMGGSMSMESEAGVGSSFTVTVPLGTIWDSPERVAGGDASPALVGVRVLAVDDNATARAVLDSHLASWGMRVETVGDGVSALTLLATAAAENDPFQVAVIDMTIPEMDGAEVAARTRAAPALAATHLVLLGTGRTIGAEPPAGIRAIVPKPIVAHVLHDALVDVLQSAPVRSADAPPADPPAAGPAVVAADPVRRRDRGRVLVVEDNATNQMVATGLLSRLGFNVEVVSDGYQAVEAVAHSDFATVLMDCNMPVMDGYAATAAIRHWEQTAGVHVPIVAMTASALVGDRERCLAVGMDDYLSKPVTMSDLERVLSRWEPSAEPAVGRDPIDGEQLDGLRALDEGDGAFLAGVVESFEASVAETLRALGEAVETADAVALALIAHRFKGEASMLGAGDLAAACTALESIISPVDQAEAREMVARVQQAADRATVRLQFEVGGGRP